MPLLTRLPGIRFDVVSAPTQEALVRMDIAAFVGFAASGPLHLPVAIEAVADFEEIFGDDLALAKDDSGSVLYAYLAPAVRAFFRNGGKRCWAVRVADESAVANVFAISGLFVLEGGSLSQAKARARSEGSWSDGLLVSAALESRPVVVTSFDAVQGTLGLQFSSPGEVSAGDLLKLAFPDGSLLWFFVDAIASTPALTAGFANAGTAIASSIVSYPQASTTPLTNGGGLPVCERLTMDLFVRDEGSSLWSLSGLGFSPLHPRYWASLPDDYALYSIDAPDGLALNAAHPRFPLACFGSDDNDQESLEGRYFIPRDIGPLPIASAPSLTSSMEPACRNGLATFDPSLFLDPALADTGLLDLLAEAEYIRDQSPSPRRLKGIHAVLAIEEVTIVAVPDAVHRGWEPAFEDPIASPPASGRLPHPDWWHSEQCVTDASIPIADAPPTGAFLPSDLQIIDPPVLTHTEVFGGTFTLTWENLPGALDIVEEAVDPAFATATVLYGVASGSLTMYGKPKGDYFYRLRRQIGAATSDYSNIVALRIDVEPAWQIAPTAAYTNELLLPVHTALLRMAAARGDLFGVLSMPLHFSPAEVLRYTTALCSPSLETYAMTYGALYHPWLTGREENDFASLRTNPPDGAQAGVMAKRAKESGAWIAPANRVLRGIVALTPAVPEQYRQPFQDAAVNLFRKEPAGFVCLCSSTLSSDPDLSPLNVRRLLCFLKKTAVRTGVDYVFETNSYAFWRAVQRGFENVLERLFLRGAFAGRNSSEGFQVIVDATLNTPAAMDNGEVFVEIKVAPSLPLRFLTLRLLQTNDRTSVTEVL